MIPFVASSAFKLRLDADINEDAMAAAEFRVLTNRSVQVRRVVIVGPPSLFDALYFNEDSNS